MTEGSEIEYDPDLGISFVNDTDIPTGEIRNQIMNLPEVAVLRRWAVSNQNGSRKKTIFDRDKYISPDNIFEKFQIALLASETDDVVANVVETTEQLAFKRVAIECEDADEQNVWNQVIDEMNLSERLRECWREIFTISQAYPAVMYQRKNFKVKGKGRKREFKNLIVPVGMSLLDPMKVIPVGNFMFNNERLVYLADKQEAQEFDTLAGYNTTDLVVDQLIERKYQPWNDGPNYDQGRDELRYLMELTGQSNIENRMYLLRPDNVWRITSTRPQYQRFASVRMESVFELLDMKHQLREMDRSSILGTTNAIILIKKGDKDHPAKPQELEQLSAQVQMTSRIPIIVGDHRLSIEIITPKSDRTLDTQRYDGIDSRIMSRLYQILSTSTRSSDDSMKLLKVIASSMEARRDQIRDSFMQHIFKPVWMNNDQLLTEPKMAFYPRRIALDFDPNIALFFQQLRDRGDISRETILAELDILEEDESIKRQREQDYYDKIFSPVNVPFSSPNPVNPANPPGQPATPNSNGNQGGNRNGGGMNPNSVVPNTP
jgi:hypothetical protein